ncbi:class F sortase [Nocardioides sp. zg-536]|uniref:Class F sortase n=1 Tax=Nocardioides faecalis TaxID=2803858 RepID=A0A938XXU0_9ACTN|nr:class F sortase [Nocardioides faecalis]MBM9458432.1 class F sortase [Nocardioides faecalis]MBS4753260.1 class F sortase [Nocardioides faecalis]QVI58447.1 class F sortase [Nocardioides faecalis]
MRTSDLDRTGRLGRTGRVVLAVVLVLLAVGALAQVPLATYQATLEQTVAFLLGRSTETYDEEAARVAGDPAADTAAGQQAAEPSQEAEAEHGPLSLAVSAWDRTFRVVDVARGDQGALVPPDDVKTLGRWDQGALPGDGSGTVVLVVHRDSAKQGRGPFAHLEELPMGSEVTLGGQTYRLESLDTYAKSELPAQKVFGQDGPERLVIVTCGGSYSSARGWDSNLVATFVPTLT